MESIVPTKILKEGEKYILDDKDYLLIKAIQELTTAINKLRMNR